MVLGALMLWVCWRMARHLRIVARLLLALGLFVVFDWLSPQIYYLWYLVIFDGLPLQWVAGYLPRPLDAAKILALMGPDSLSAHARTLLGWGMIGVALLSKGTNARGPSTRTGPWVD